MTAPTSLSAALLRAVPAGLDSEVRAYLADPEMPDRAKRFILDQLDDAAASVAVVAERLSVAAAGRATFHRANAAGAAQAESRAAQRAAEAAAVQAEGELVTNTTEFARSLGLTMREVEFVPGWWGEAQEPPRRFEIAAPSGHPLVELVKPQTMLLRRGELTAILWSGPLEDAVAWLDRATKTVPSKPIP